MTMAINPSGANTPFIKKFKDNDSFYLFDVNTNQIIQVEKPVYDLIDFYGQEDTATIETQIQGLYSLDTITRTLAEINEAHQSQGLFSSFRPRKVTLGLETAAEVEALHQKGLNQLVLELTKQCNLNCSYCPASGHYYRDNGAPPHMSLDICRQAVDFFLPRAASETAAITFYGGEPLLRFHLIKDTVERVKNKWEGKNIFFNLTTNLTLLTPEYLDFFIANSVGLTVSLDGPEQVHNRYRLFKHNGTGTFQRILENLTFIKNYDNDYFKRYISISAVLAPPYDEMNQTIDFFATHETIKSIKNVRSSTVNTDDTTFLEDFHIPNSPEEIKKLEEPLIRRLKQAIMAGDISGLSIEKKKLYMVLHNLARRPIQKLYEYIHPMGACHIGLRRVFVNTGGGFNICERVHDSYRIGNINQGFDYEQIARYYLKFEEVLEDCRHCWALNHCDRCWASIGPLNEFTGDKKDTYCGLNRRAIEKALRFYTQLLRENPDCLKVFGETETAATS